MNPAGVCTNHTLHLENMISIYLFIYRFLLLIIIYLLNLLLFGYAISDNTGNYSSQIYFNEKKKRLNDIAQGTI